MNYFALIFVAFGLFSIVGSYFELGFFMSSRKASRMIRLLGMTGAKIFYILLGLALVTLGLLGFFNIIDIR
jgi:small neutral amino acid transporter SnatA (MarC family)